MGCHSSKEVHNPEHVNNIQAVLKIADEKTPTEKRHKSRRNRSHRGRPWVHSGRASSVVADARITAKYIIKARIGKGDFSCVVRVEHRTSKQPYAMKILDTSKGRTAFDTELSVLRRVNHPNIVRIIEILDADEKSVHRHAASNRW